jgi:hypothetical protein
MLLAAHVHLQILSAMGETRLRQCGRESIICLPSKQRNGHLQTALIEAAKLAPRWNPQLALLHTRELERGHANRATLVLARKLVAYLLAVDKSGRPFQLRPPAPNPAANTLALKAG